MTLRRLYRRRIRHYQSVPDSQTMSPLANNTKAKMHGNEPSKGAKVDAEIAADEEEYLRRKGKA